MKKQTVDRESIPQGGAILSNPFLAGMHRAVYPKYSSAAVII